MPHVSNASPARWQLPPGVTRGLWDYARAGHIADDYDEFFAYNRLFDFDEAVLARHLSAPGLVADLGCGTGRALVPLVRRGFRGLAVDLSLPMLRVVAEKCREEGLAVDCLRANLVDLDAVQDASVDGALCLFSTLGMIRGSAHRRRAMAHMRRILKPGGVLVLHVHNLWFNLTDTAGRWWLAGHLLRVALRRDLEAGDRFFPYRGIANMYLHTFRMGELTRLVRGAGFRILETIPLARRRDQPLRRPWLAGRFRANGWIVVCAAE